MNLQRQQRERGYAMAALLVSLAVMSVLMSAVLPAWRHQARREKEAELIFRGEQYVRAIGLWERKMGPGSRPPSFDILVEQRFLRKKYKDPMTADGEFQPILAGAVGPQAPAGGRQGGPQPAATPPGPGGRGGGGAGIFGVQSKSTEASIRIYNGARHYNAWQFIHASAASAPGGGRGEPTPGGRMGAPMPGRGGPGRGIGPGGRGIGPGGRGIGPGRGGRGIGPAGRGGPPGPDGRGQ